MSTDSRPFERARCTVCGAPVLVVGLERYGQVAVEPEEIECPVVRCPACKGRLPQVRQCFRCNGSGKVGERYPTRAVGVTEEGLARWWRRGLGRRRGEALHVPHEHV